MDLPEEVLLRIFSLLSRKDKVLFERVCKAWLQVVRYACFIRDLNVLLSYWSMQFL